MSESLFNKIRPATLKKTPMQVFSCEFYEIFKGLFLYSNFLYLKDYHYCHKRWERWLSHSVKLSTKIIVISYSVILTLCKKLKHYVSFCNSQIRIQGFKVLYSFFIRMKLHNEFHVRHSSLNDETIWSSFSLLFIKIITLQIT